jgi:hypothetical protein
MKGGLSKEVVSHEGEVDMGHATFVTSKVGLTEEVVFHKDVWSLKGGYRTTVCLIHTS